MRNSEAVRGGDEFAGIPERDSRRESGDVDRRERSGGEERRAGRRHDGTATPASRATSRRGRPATRSRTCAGAKSRHNRPPDATAIAAVCSDTTNTRASVSSVRPKRRAVPRPERTIDHRRLRQRKDARRADDRVAADDDRAIMQRRVGSEDRGEQVGRDLRLHHRPGVHVLVEGNLSLDGDDRADAFAAETLDRLGDAVADFRFLHSPEHARESRPAELRERGANLRREHDEQRDHAVARDERQQIDDHVELQHVGDAVAHRPAATIPTST